MIKPKPFLCVDCGLPVKQHPHGMCGMNLPEAYACASMLATQRARAIAHLRELGKRYCQSVRDGYFYAPESLRDEIRSAIAAYRVIGVLPCAKKQAQGEGGGNA